MLVGARLYFAVTAEVLAHEARFDRLLDGIAQEVRRWALPSEAVPLGVGAEPVGELQAVAPAPARGAEQRRTAAAAEGAVTLTTNATTVHISNSNVMNSGNTSNTVNTVFNLM